MKRFIRIIIMPVMVFHPFVSFCQDSTSTFKIRKPIFATAAGLRGGTVDRKVLVDSGGIIIHGCDGCRIIGFEMTGKINQNHLSGNSLKDSSSVSSISNPQINGWGSDDNGVMQSDSDSFSRPMKNFILIKNKLYRTYFIEISDIKIRTSKGEERTLDNIDLYLK